MNNEITITNNPTMIELLGDHQQKVSYTVKGFPGTTFSGGKIDVSVCGDFDSQSEFVTLKIAGKSLGNLSSGVEDWKYHTVKLGEDISGYIKGLKEFTIEAIPSPNVHTLWENAWGVLINFSAEFSASRVEISNWMLHERAFEPDDNAVYTFDIQNVSGFDLSSVKVHLVKDEGAWKNNGVSVITPSGMTWEFPIMHAQEKKTLTLALKSSNAVVGKYPLPQIIVESSMLVAATNFKDTDFRVEIAPD